jgi:hypothetical protein
MSDLARFTDDVAWTLRLQGQYLLRSELKRG